MRERGLESGRLCLLFSFSLWCGSASSRRCEEEGEIHSGFCSIWALFSLFPFSTFRIPFMSGERGRNEFGLVEGLDAIFLEEEQKSH